MGTLRRRVPALWLVFALLSALTVVLASPASAGPASHAHHVSKHVVLVSTDQHNTSPRLDQPLATQPHAPRSVDLRRATGVDGAAAGASAVAAPVPHTRGPPAGR